MCFILVPNTFTTIINTFIIIIIWSKSIFWNLYAIIITGTYLDRAIICIIFFYFIPYCITFCYTILCLWIKIVNEISRVDFAWILYAFVISRYIIGIIIVFTIYIRCTCFLTIIFVFIPYKSFILVISTIFNTLIIF